MDMFFVIKNLYEVVQNLNLPEQMWISFQMMNYYYLSKMYKHLLMHGRFFDNYLLSRIMVSMKMPCKPVLKPKNLEFFLGKSFN